MPLLWIVINHVISSLKTPAGPLSRTKGTRGGIVSLYHQALTRSSAAAAATVPALTLSATNVLAIGVGCPLVDLFKKQSYDDDNGVVTQTFVVEEKAEFPLQQQITLCLIVLLSVENKSGCFSPW